MVGEKTGGTTRKNVKRRILLTKKMEKQVIHAYCSELCLFVLLQMSNRFVVCIKYAFVREDSLHTKLLHPSLGRF